MIRRIALLALILTSIVVVFGAYVRLSDAGLGCPDWPLCYGKITPAHAADVIHAESAANPGGPVSMPKAWKEMIHRYLASSIGLLIVALAVLAWRRRQAFGLPLALFGVVCLQGAFGAWTVTMRLMPAVVTTHLLLGLSVLSLLAWLTLREWGVARLGAPSGLVAAARIGFVLLVLQIALGGWVSTNYAALACVDFPTCHGSLVPPDLAFGPAFQLLRDLGLTASGAPLPSAALTAIHWSHRLGALLIGSYLLLLAIALLRVKPLRANGIVLACAVLLQVSLGIANVMLMLPLHVAVSHNAGAALLVLTMVWTNYRVRTAAAVATQGRMAHEGLAA